MCTVVPGYYPSAGIWTQVFMCMQQEFFSTKPFPQPLIFLILKMNRFIQAFFSLGCREGEIKCKQKSQYCGQELPRSFVHTQNTGGGSQEHPRMCRSRLFRAQLLQGGLHSLTAPSVHLSAEPPVWSIRACTRNFWNHVALTFAALNSLTSPDTFISSNAIDSSSGQYLSLNKG